MEITVEQLREALALKEQIAALEDRLELVLNGSFSPKRGVGRPRRDKEPAGVEELMGAVGKGKPAKSGKKLKWSQTPEGRAALSEAAKARWAKRRKS